MVRTGALVGTWRGEAVGYRAMHQRLGPLPDFCTEGCGRRADEWSLNANASGLRSEISGRFKGRLFSTIESAYSPRCYRCHAKQDGHSGSMSTMAKLTENQVLEIRSRSTGLRGEQVALAREFGVTKHAIWRILNKKCWRDL